VPESVADEDSLKDAGLGALVAAILRRRVEVQFGLGRFAPPLIHCMSDSRR
jgi:hypothetical protein